MNNERITFWDVLRSCGSWRIKSVKILDFCLGACWAGLLPARERTPDNVLGFKKILVIRPGGIGDAVFLLPVLTALKQHDPNIRVDVLCEKRNREIFDSQKQLVSNVYCYDSLAEIIFLFKQNYDVVIDTEQWHYLSAIVAYYIKARHTAGFATRPLRAKLFNLKVEYGVDEYELNNFQKIFEAALGVKLKIDGLKNSFVLNNSLLEWAEKEVPENSVAIFSGGSIEARRLTKQQVIDLVESLIQNGKTAVLLGGKDQNQLGADLEAKFKSSSFLNYIGKTTLQESAALIKKCKLFIGTDSGLLHLANAVGTPAVGIFGSGNWQKWGMRGRGENFSLNLHCSPCALFGYTMPTCHGKYDCVKSIKIADIISMIKDGC